MVSTRPAADRVLRHARVRGPHPPGADRLARTTSSPVVSQPDRPKGRGQQLQPTPTKAVADEPPASRCSSPSASATRRSCARYRELQPDLGGRRGLRQDPAGRAAGDSPARHDQRPRVAAAGVSRRRAGSPGGDRRRRRDRRHDHAGGHASSTPVRCWRSCACRSRPTRRAARSSARSPTLGAPLLLAVVDAARRGTAVETPQDDARATYAREDHEGRRGDRLDAAGRRASTTRCAGCSRGRSLSRTRLDGRPPAIASPAPSCRDARRRPPEGGTWRRSIAGVPGGRADGVARRRRTALRVLEIQPEGQAAMTAREFLAGHTIRPTAHGSSSDDRAGAARRATSVLPRSPAAAPTCPSALARARTTLTTNAIARSPARSRPARCAGRRAFDHVIETFAERPLDEAGRRDRSPSSGSASSSCSISIACRRPRR